MADDGIEGGAADGSVGERIAKAGLAVGSVHLILKTLGIAQTILIAHYLGARGEADTFFWTMDVIAFIFLVGEESIGPAFLPVFREYKDASEREAWDLASTVFNIQLVLLVAVMALLVAYPEWIIARFTGWKTEKAMRAAELLPYMAVGLVGLSLGSLTYKILNGYKRFFWAAFGDASSKIVFILSIILGMGVMRLDISSGLKIMAVGVAVGGFAKFATHIAALGPKVLLYRFTLAVKAPAFRKMMVLVAPLLIGIIFAKVRDYYNGLYVLSSLEESGLISCNKYGRKLFDTVGWLVPYAVSIAMFPFFCEMVDRMDLARLGNVVTRSARMLFVVCVPLTLGAVVVAWPVTELLFAHGRMSREAARLAALSTACYTLVIPFYALEYFLMQAFFSMRRMATPVVIGLVFSALSVGLCATCIFGFGWSSPPEAIAVVALSFTISRILKVVALVVFLKRRVPVLKMSETLPFLARCLVMGVGVGAAVYGVRVLAERQWYPMDLPGLGRISIACELVAAALVGASVFFILSRLLRLEEMEMMLLWSWRKIEGKVRGKVRRG